MVDSAHPDVFVPAEKECPQLASLLPALGPDALYVADKTGDWNARGDHATYTDGTKLSSAWGRTVVN